MAENIADFLVEIGFKNDPSVARKVAEVVAKTEADITKAVDTEATKRTAVEQKAGTARLSLAQACGRLLVLEGEKFAYRKEQDRKASIERLEKMSRDEAEKEEKRQAEAAKVARDRREKALKNMQAGALRLASLAVKAVTAVSAATLGIFYSVDKAASGMERLHYAANWSGSSVKGMNSFTFAASQLGDSIEDAQHSVEAFGNKLKTLPFLENSLKNMGIKTRDNAGNWRESSQLLAEYLSKLKDLPKLQRDAKAGMFDVSENTARVGVDPRFGGYMNQYAADQAAVGNDDDADAAGGTKFAQSARRAQEIGGGIVKRVQGDLFKDLGPQLDKLSDWMSANGDSIAAILERIARDMLAFAEAVSKKLAKIDWNAVLTKVEDFVKEFDTLATKYLGENGAITLTLGAFGLIVTSKLTGPLRAAADALKLLIGIPMPAWFLALTVGSGVAQWDQAKQTTKILQDADPAKNDVVVDPESGFATKVEPGAGNQFPGTADPKTGWFQRLQRALGFGDQSAATGGPDPVTDTDGNALHRNESGLLGWLKSKGRSPSAQADAPDLRVRDAIISTDKGIKELVEVTKHPNAAGGDGGGGDAVSVSSGGIGGSGHHFSGVSSPGATIVDRAHGSRGGAGAADPNLPVGNVPGASGYGAINAYWRGPLDKRGEGGFTGPKEMFDYLKSQGATDNEAVLLTGSAASESSFNPNAVHDGGTGHGLFGHKDTRLDMRGKNWQQQSVLALGELRRTLGSRVNAARTPEELTDVEMHNERPRGYKSNNPRAGDNYMGRLNSIRRFQALTGRPTAMAPTPAGTSEKAVTDAEVFAARQRIMNGSRSPKDKALVDRYLKEQNTPKAAVPSVGHDDRVDRAPSSDVPAKVEVVKPLPGFHAAMAHLRQTGTLQAALHPHLNHPFGVSPALMASIDNSRKRGDMTVTHNPVFNIHGDTRTAMNESRLIAGRSYADVLRHIETKET